MTNAYQVSIAARQLLEGYTAAMQPLCRREGLAPNGVDILLFLANNPGLDTARDVCTYRGLKPGIVSFHVEKLVQEGYLLRQPAPGDRRKCRLVCTEKAGPVVQQGRELQETFFRRLARGLEPEDLAAFRRDNLGFVFQDFNLLDTFSLRDNILLPLVLSRRTRNDAGQGISGHGAGGTAPVEAGGAHGDRPAGEHAV